MAAIVVELAVAPSLGRGTVAGLPAPQTVVTIDGRRLTNLPAMHVELARAFGFPDYYGANLDALLDCLSSLDAPDDGLSTVHVGAGGLVVLAIDHAEAAAAAVFATLCDVVAAANLRVRERRGAGLIAIAGAR